MILGHGHAHVRAGLRQIFLDEGLADAVTEAASAEEIMAILKKGQWNLIVLATSLAGPPLHDQLALFRTVDPTIRCVVLSCYPHASVTALLIECGADAVVMEERIDEDLIPMVQRVRRGEYASSRGHREDRVRLTAAAGEEPSVSAPSSTDRKSVRANAGAHGHPSAP